MLILAIDTSCDETSVAVTQGTTVLSNIIWSQASAHAEFGGVMPSLAARMHRERIDWVVKKAVSRAQCTMDKIEVVAVTMGPGLAIALGVGIEKAKQMANELKVPLFGINHIEGHLLSPLAKAMTKLQSTSLKNSPSSSPSLIKEGEGDFLDEKILFPALGLVVSGGHTELVYIEKIGKYKILAETQDDALGEALDKAARMLGLGYPGGEVLEKMAKLGNPKAYPLPLPMARQKDRFEFSYSGLKTAFYRLIEKQGQLDKQMICDLASSFQNRAFQHLTRVTQKRIQELKDKEYKISDLLVGGGVIANVDLRNRLRKMGKELGLKVHFPYSKKLIGDNAAMIGVAAHLRYKDSERQRFRDNFDLIDRRARWSVEEI